MDLLEIANWAHAHGAPFPDICDRLSFRCAARLTDGTYLPCVQLREAEPYVKLAMRRLDETRNNDVTDPSNLMPGSYPTIVQSFIASGNRISFYDIAELEVSPYAIPLERAREIKGETRMSWTAFAGVMADGKEFSFGTTYHSEFFNMPPGYEATQIHRIIPHKNEAKPVYREKPFFVCFLENVEFGAA